MDATWIVMPIVSSPEYTRAAIADGLAQSIPTRLLLINQGVDDAFRTELEAIAEEHDDRVLLWSHQPPLPSLAATWNRALEFVWEAGGIEALVVNNDVRLHRDTCKGLQTVLLRCGALFVSCVGVRPEQYDPTMLIEPDHYTAPDDRGDGHPTAPGGPDFSCFLISHECHLRFPFDEAFTPAYCEDIDLHRRIMLAGEGARIFSVNLPFLHYGSTVLKTVKDRGTIDRAIAAGSRAHYRAKWGGDCNQETFFSPFDNGVTYSTASMPDPPTTPALQEWCRGQIA